MNLAPSPHLIHRFALRVNDGSLPACLSQSWATELNSMVADIQDTIVALSSAPGRGGRAIVRLSGPAALRCAATRFTAADPLTLPSPPAPGGEGRVRGVRSNGEARRTFPTIPISSLPLSFTVRHRVTNPTARLAKLQHLNSARSLEPLPLAKMIASRLCSAALR